MEKKGEEQRDVLERQNVKMDEGAYVKWESLLGLG